MNSCFMLSCVCLFFGCTLSLVLKIKSDWKLEIALDGTTLMLTTKSVIDFDVNLGAIECSITRIYGPWSSKLI